jgi:uncharacterized protein YyaL (SSP411 family)
MERESFEDEETAKLLNQWFVCIKVDREERPDIDHIYMTALNVFTEHGGWPLSMFLTADGKPFFGGTYWPREDREVEGVKVRGFKSVLKAIHEFDKDNRKKLEEQADKVAEATTEALGGTARGVAVIDLDRKLVAGAVDAVKEEFDPVHGGFGSPQRDFRGTKFPMPTALELLRSEAVRSSSAELAHIVTFTLDHMAAGGIYDHLGGGFHRYSTERTWTVPHFEKMLYDNAQLVEVYAQTYQNGRSPRYRRVLEETLTFVSRELTSPEGVFYSALDADAEGEEGKFYVWTDKDLDAVLTDRDDAALIKQVYGLDGPANFESNYHILVLTKPLADVAKERKVSEEQLEARLIPLRQKLLEARSKRPRPFLDTKVLTSWNGQMIAGYAAAAQALGEKKYLETARRAADFLLTNLRTKEGRLLRTYGAAPGQKAEARLNGYLDDYAYLVHGLLNLYDATSEERWLNEARSLTDTMIQFHGDKNGGFFYTSSDHEKLFARAKDQFDGAQPSGNSVAARNLVRLWIKTGDDKYRAEAEKTFKAFAGPLRLNPSGLTAMADALALYLEEGKKK